MQYIFHLGVHGTAPAALAPYLTAHVHALRAQKVYFVNAEAPEALDAMQTALTGRYLGTSDAPQDAWFHEANHAVADAARDAGARSVLVLSPDMLGPSLPRALSLGRIGPGLYDAAPEMLRLATLGLPAKRVQCVLVPEDTETLLLNLYSDGVRQGLTALRLDAFCDAIDLDHFSTGHLLARLRDAHPRHRITDRPDPGLRAGVGPFLRGVLDDLGLDPGAFPVEKPDLPARLDAFQIEALLHITDNGQSRNASRVAQLRDRVLCFAPDPAQPLHLPDWVSAVLSDSDETEAVA
ncbi:MAG: hypothetical protein AAGA28_13735 [Pseudomonadota bacterium]